MRKWSRYEIPSAIRRACGLPRWRPAQRRLHAQTILLICRVCRSWQGNPQASSYRAGSCAACDMSASPFAGWSAMPGWLFSTHTVLGAGDSGGHCARCVFIAQQAPDSDNNNGPWCRHRDPCEGLICRGACSRCAAPLRPDFIDASAWQGRLARHLPAALISRPDTAITTNAPATTCLCPCDGLLLLGDLSGLQSARPASQREMSCLASLAAGGQGLCSVVWAGAATVGREGVAGAQAQRVWWSAR